MVPKLAERVAIVTGASSGIGRAAAKHLAAEGARLVLAGRDPAALQETASAVQATGTIAVTVAGDLLQASACRDLIDTALATQTRIDVLVNAAGVIGTGSIESTEPQQWDEMMRLNLDSVYRLMHLAIPHLKQTQGCVVNVSSVTGLRAFPGVLAYCVSKAGIDQLTRCAALELAAAGVRVNAVNPGVVVTNLHRRGGMDEDAYAGFLEHGKSTHPLGRVGTAADIAAAIVFLASDDSSWITGETLSVDGGRHLTCAR